jgi:hypothetical protein
MLIRQTFLRFVVFAVMVTVSQSQDSTSHTSPIFEFHNGFWVNLHHFLFTAAQGSSAIVVRPQVDPIDGKELDSLSGSERKAWNAALSYYASTLVHRDLLMDRDMEEIKNELENSENSSDLATAKISSELKSILLTAAPIYRKHWWPRHETVNRDWISILNPLLGRYGNLLTSELAKIYEVPWPEQPIRVDVVGYANWAGAYTTLYPTRPTISSLNAANQGTASLEIAFHEASHGMMTRVMDAIRGAEKEQAAQHRNAFRDHGLWHEVLFYTSGELVAKLVPDYAPYADKNGLWDRAWPGADREALERDWKPHMQGSVALEAALAKLVSDLSSVQESQHR